MEATGAAPRAGSGETGAVMRRCFRGATVVAAAGWLVLFAAAPAAATAPDQAEEALRVSDEVARRAAESPAGASETLHEAREATQAAARQSRETADELAGRLTSAATRIAGDLYRIALGTDAEQHAQELRTEVSARIRSVRNRIDVLKDRLASEQRTAITRRITPPGPPRQAVGAGNAGAALRGALQDVRLGAEALGRELRHAIGGVRPPSPAAGSGGQAPATP